MASKNQSGNDRKCVTGEICAPSRACVLWAESECRFVNNQPIRAKANWASEFKVEKNHLKYIELMTKLFFEASINKIIYFNTMLFTIIFMSLLSYFDVDHFKKVFISEAQNAMFWFLMYRLVPPPTTCVHVLSDQNISWEIENLRESCRHFVIFRLENAIKILFNDLQWPL